MNATADRSVACQFTVWKQSGPFISTHATRLEKIAARRLRLQADFVVHRAPKALLAPEVSLGGLYRNVTKQELDLLQFASCRMAQPRAGPATVMWRQFRNATFGRRQSRTPMRLAPFTRRMPAARSGLRSPVSAASYASRRTAASRRLMVAGASRRASRSEAVAKHHRFAERQSWLGTVPSHKIIDTKLIGSL